MIGYAMVGSNDLERARAFYGALLSAIGAGVRIESPRATFYGTGEGAMLAVCEPWDKQPASTGNGVMVALPVDSRERVAQLHALALKLGASDEGSPGERYPGFYMAYFRDLDGNKLAFFHFTPVDAAG